MPRGGYRKNAGRKSGWKDPKIETTVIRVPKYLAAELIEIAKTLDFKGSFDFSKDSEYESTLNSVKEIVLDWRSKSNPTSTRWEKANALLSSLEELLGIPSQAVSRELIGRTEVFGETVYSSLKESQLAFRLGVPDSTLGNKRRDNPKTFASWTRTKDPEGIGWEYSTDSKLYSPLIQ